MGQMWTSAAHKGVSYYLVNRWLQDFPYRAGIGIEVYLFSSLTAMLVGLLTISFQVIKAARTNPIDTLRCE